MCKRQVCYTCIVHCNSTGRALDRHRIGQGSVLTLRPKIFKPLSKAHTPKFQFQFDPEYSHVWYTNLWLGRSGNQSSRYRALKNCSGHFAHWILFFQSLWLSFGFHCWFLAKAIISENHWEVYTLTHSVVNIQERALRNNMHMKE